jgi:hypothetical protein
MIWSLCGVSVGFLGEVVQLSEKNRWLPGHSRYRSQGTLLLMFLYRLHFILLPKDCVRTVAEVVGMSRLLEGTYMAAC